LRPPPSKVPPSVEDRLKQLLPNADPLLVHRAAETWGDVAIQATEQHQEPGLKVLEAFQDEAAYCLQHDAKAFAALVRVMRLDPERFRLASGPWNRAVLDWAQSGKLERFLDRLEGMQPTSLATAETVPAALPLLCAENTPIAHAMLEKYGDRAWRLFMMVNFTEHPEDLERVARAVSDYGDLVLEVNEGYGLPFALLLVPPDTDKGSRQFPVVAKYVLEKFAEKPAALAFLTVNYSTLSELLDEGKAIRDLTDAIDAFLALPVVVQQLALDHTNTLRLLMETWHGQRLGNDALCRCGPAAADLIYNYYGSDDRLKLPALLALAKLGWPAYGVLERYHSYGNFHKFLRRAEPEGLMNPQHNPPLIVQAVYQISRLGQEKLDSYAEVTNLTGQIQRDTTGPLPEEAVLEWVPGYIAYRTARDWKSGYSVTGGDVFWGTVDAITAGTMVYGVAADAAKTVVGKAGQETVETVAKELLPAGETAVTDLEKKTAQSALEQLQSQSARLAEELAEEALKREGADLSRFGAKAPEIASKRLEAQTSGLLVASDRREEYLALAKQLNIDGKARLIEELGDEGARKYAAAVGYEPVYQAKPGTGRGFDHVYRDGNRIKVVEVKGGDSPLSTYYGHQQGTMEYTREVATRALKSPRPEERKTAQLVLDAMQEQRVDVEVVRTRHVQGRPQPTRVESIVSPTGAVKLDPKEARALLRKAPGMAAGWVEAAAQAAETQPLNAALAEGHAVSSHVGISLWHNGDSVLAPRSVCRKGAPLSLSVGEVSPLGSPGAVGEFSTALMERML
jgi:hypothetical protein